MKMIGRVWPASRHFWKRAESVRQKGGTGAEAGAYPKFNSTGIAALRRSEK
jgi:hypothetical protein